MGTLRHPVNAAATLAVLLFAPFAARAQDPAPAAGAATESAVTGTVSYLQRIALPPESRVEVMLVDVSRADAPATPVARQTIQTQGKQPPYLFTLTYDPAKIDPAHRYAVRAQIFTGDTLRFTTTRSYPVLTQGAGKSAQIIVQMTGAPAREGNVPAVARPARPTAPGQRIVSGTYQRGATQGSFDATFQGNRLVSIRDTVKRGDSATGYANYEYYRSGALRKYMARGGAMSTAVNPKTPSVTVDVTAEFNTRGIQTQGYQRVNGKRTFLRPADLRAIKEQAAELRAEALRLQGG